MATPPSSNAPLIPITTADLSNATSVETVTVLGDPAISRPSPNQRIDTACLLTVAFIAVGLALYFLRPVVVPFILAAFFYYLLSPMIALLSRRLRVPRPVAIVLAGIIGLVALTTAGLVIGQNAIEIGKQAPIYRQGLDDLAVKISKYSWAAKFGLQDKLSNGKLLQFPEQATNSFLSTVASELTSLISNGSLVFIFLLFMLIGSGRTTPSNLPGQDAGGLLGEIEKSVQGYIRQMVIFSIITGIAVAGILQGFSVQFAVVFGFLAMILSFIPTVGGLLATLLPVPVILLDNDLSTTGKILAIFIPAAFQTILGSVIQPRFQGKALDLHPVTVMIAVVFFGILWGLVGAFLATPIAAVLKIVLYGIPQTRNLGKLMAGDLTWLQTAGRSV